MEPNGIPEDYYYKIYQNRRCGHRKFINLYCNIIIMYYSLFTHIADVVKVKKKRKIDCKITYLFIYANKNNKVRYK